MPFDAAVRLEPAKPPIDMIVLELCDAEPSGVDAVARRPAAGSESSAPNVSQATESLSEMTRAALLKPATAATPDDHIDGIARLPGSHGEHMLHCAYGTLLHCAYGTLLHCAYGTQDRARRFYADQVLDRLNPAMVEFVGRMEMIFVATADTRGECDASLRAGPPGFIQVPNSREIAYPEYRGNGVMASLGNISENPHVGLLMIDFVTDLIGLHINGRARVADNAELRRRHPSLPVDHERGRSPERWVTVEIEEAYIHCRKHIPRMVPVVRQRAWGTDDVRRKGGDYFGARATANATAHTAAAGVN